MDHKAYLSDPGIYRNGNRFYYHKNNKEVKGVILQRLSKLVVPPAWGSVWYASKTRCHIQVYGIDAGGKKQYILSEKWVKNSKYEKFHRMKRFIKDLASFKRKIKLNGVVINKENLIKLLFHLLIDLHIRVGNEIYAEQNKTYGLTTLRQKHLLFNNNYQLKFIGKSNIEHIINIPSEYTPWFDRLKNQNKNNPLFQYNGIPVSSEELNVYLKENMGKEYTCKDFRTYSANMLFIKTFLKSASTQNKFPKKIVLESIDRSAKHLGHTRSISRKSYISERLIDYCVDCFSEASRLSPSELLSKV